MLLCPSSHKWVLCICVYSRICWLEFLISQEPLTSAQLTEVFLFPVLSVSVFIFLFPTWRKCGVCSFCFPAAQSLSIFHSLGSVSLALLLASVIVKYSGSQPSCVSLDLAFLPCQGHAVSPALTFPKLTFRVVENSSSNFVITCKFFSGTLTSCLWCLWCYCGLFRSLRLTLVNQVLFSQFCCIISKSWVTCFIVFECQLDDISSCIWRLNWLNFL